MLFRADSCDVYALNGTAALAWQLRAAGKSLEEAAADYAERYRISLALAHSDIESAWNSWSQTLLAPADSADHPPKLDEVSEPSLDDFSAHYLYCGHTIRVRLDAGIVAEEIRPRIAVLLTHSDSAPDIDFRVTVSANGYSVVKDSVVIATEPNVAEARIRFLHEFVRSARAEADLLAVFHAAACGDETRCLVIPGISQSGKTTLAAALMHSGLFLYAEDTVMLETGSLTVPSAPFSLMIRDGSWPVVSSLFPSLLETPSVSRSGISVRFLQPPWDGREKSASVSAIVFVRFQARAATCLNPITMFDAVIRLKDIGFWVKHDYESTSMFVRWLHNTPVYELTYSRLDEAIPVVRSLLYPNPEHNQSHNFPGSLACPSM